MNLKNLKNLEGYLLFIEYAYNINIHTTTNYSHFEIIYDFDFNNY
jgi:hypothetical protein